MEYFTAQYIMKENILVIPLLFIYRVKESLLIHLNVSAEWILKPAICNEIIWN